MTRILRRLIVLPVLVLLFFGSPVVLILVIVPAIVHWAATGNADTLDNAITMYMRAWERLMDWAEGWKRQSPRRGVEDEH